MTETLSTGDALVVAVVMVVWCLLVRVALASPLPSVLVLRGDVVMYSLSLLRVPVFLLRQCWCWLGDVAI